MVGATDIFFKMGDWATRGDPDRQADFTYYMLWILFSAFLSMFCLNTYRLVTTWDPSFAIWAAIGFAITSLQYFNLKQMYEMRKLRRNKTPAVEQKVESVKEMLDAFSVGEEEVDGDVYDDMKDYSKKDAKDDKGKV